MAARRSPAALGPPADVRRALRVVALALIVLGLEVATSGVGYTLERLGGGFAAATSGEVFHTTRLAYATGVAGAVTGLLLFLFVSWTGRVAVEAGRVGVTCPTCESHTERVKRRPWQRWMSAVLGQRLSRRRCTACGWTGLSVRQ